LSALFGAIAFPTCNGSMTPVDFRSVNGATVGDLTPEPDLVRFVAVYDRLTVAPNG
jgi:hypothetical protein